MNIYKISSSNIIIIIINYSYYLFILLPSLSLSPTAPVFTALSLPAKSTKLILDTFSPLTPLFESVNVCVRMTENTACERELSEFIFVAATVLDLLPSAIRLSMSCKIVRLALSIFSCYRYRFSLQREKSWIDSGSVRTDSVKGNFWTRVTWNRGFRSLWKCWEIRVIGLGNSADGMYGLMMVTGWPGMLCKWFLRFSLVGKFNWDWTVTFVWSCNLLGKDFSFNGEHSVIIVSKNVISEGKNWLSMIFKMHYQSLLY